MGRGGGLNMFIGVGEISNIFLGGGRSKYG